MRNCSTSFIDCANYFYDTLQLFNFKEYITMMIKQSRARTAIAWAKEHNVSLYAAAKEFGMAANSLYTEVKRSKTRPVCPCCMSLLTTERAAAANKRFHNRPARTA